MDTDIFKHQQIQLMDLTQFFLEILVQEVNIVLRSAHLALLKRVVEFTWVGRMKGLIFNQTTYQEKKYDI